MDPPAHLVVQVDPQADLLDRPPNASAGGAAVRDNDSAADALASDNNNAAADALARDNNNAAADAVVRDNNNVAADAVARYNNNNAVADAGGRDNNNNAAGGGGDGCINLILVFIQILVQSFLALVSALLSDNSKHVSHSKSVLIVCALGSDSVGCIAFLVYFVLHRNGSDAVYLRIARVAGFGGAAIGLIPLLCMVLPDHLNLWVALGVSILIIPPLIVAGMR